MSYIPREDTSSLTIPLEELMVILVVNAYEGQYVAIYDVPGEYLNADIPDDKYVRLKLEGRFMDIMCDMNPYHIPNICLQEL